MHSDMPPEAVPPDPGQRPGHVPAGGPGPSTGFPTAPPLNVHQRSRWPAFSALAVALIALGIGIAGWFRPAPHTTPPPSKPSYTDQQIADAKAKVCAAYGKLDRAVGVLNALPNGPDKLVPAINTRQVFDVFSRYLLATLAEQPATPADLASAVRKDAKSLEEAVIGYEDGFSNSDAEMRSVVEANTEAAETIRRLCK
jgi:hypothetical protein